MSMNWATIRFAFPECRPAFMTGVLFFPEQPVDVISEDGKWHSGTQKFVQVEACRIFACSIYSCLRCCARVWAIPQRSAPHSFDPKSCADSFLFSEAWAQNRIGFIASRDSAFLPLICHLNWSFNYYCALIFCLTAISLQSCPTTIMACTDDDQGTSLFASALGCMDYYMASLCPWQIWNGSISSTRVRSISRVVARL